MKKKVFVISLSLFIAGIVTAQEDMTFQHFYESMQFVTTTVPYGIIGNPIVLGSGDIDEARSLDKNNDGWAIIQVSENANSWSFSMIHIGSRQYVIIMISMSSNYDASRGKLYNLTNASQRTAFMNEINAIKAKFESTKR